MTKKLIFSIKTMRCASCVNAIEKEIKKLDWIKKVNVNFANCKALVEFDDTKLKDEDIFKAVEKAGYKAEKEDIHRLKEKKELKSLKIRSFISLLFSIFLISTTFVVFPKDFIQPSVIQFLLSTFVIFIGYDFFTNGIFAIFKTKKTNTDTLIAIGVITAYIYSLTLAIKLWKGNENFSHQNLHFEIAAFIISFILLGRYFEALAIRKISQIKKKLMELQPIKAIVLKENKEIEMPTTDILVDDIIVVKPKKIIPVDGVVIEGHSSVDESMITANNHLIEKTKNSTLLAGTINKSGNLKFKATKVGKDTVLSQMIKLIEEATICKIPMQKLADSIMPYFASLIMLIAIGSFCLWLFFGSTFSFSLTIFISVLIIACPRAVSHAVPTAIMAAIALGTQMGILIKNANALQKLKRVNAIVFGKTKILTQGKPKVVNIIPYSKTKTEILTYAASIEKKSHHLLAKAIVEKANKEKISLKEVSNFKEIPAKGLQAKIGNDEILIGNKNFIIENLIDISFANLDIDHLMNEGNTTILVVVNKKLVGLIAIADVIKRHVKRAMLKIQEIVDHTYMLTADSKKTAQAIGIKAKIEYHDIIAQIPPKDKANEIKKLQAKNLKVAMVGDGIKNAKELIQSDVAIAFGKATDIAIESADIILIKDDIRDVYKAIKLSKFVIKKIRQNLFWSFIYNLIAITIATGALYPFTGFLLNPIIAAIARSFSSIFVVTNSLFMKKYKKKIMKSFEK